MMYAVKSLASGIVVIVAGGRVHLGWIAAIVVFVLLAAGRVFLIRIRKNRNQS
jgi:hypothetical protein